MPRLAVAFCSSLALCTASGANGAQVRDALDRQFQSALSHYNSGHYREAAGELEDLVGRVPASFEVHELLGLVYSAEAREQEARLHLAKAVQLKPDSAAARANLAVNLAGLGKNDAAEAEFKKAVELEPDNFETNHDFGEFYVRCGNLTAALPYLAKAQQIDSSSYDNGYDLALAYEHTSRLDQARQLAHELLGRKETAELHNLLAEVEEKARNFLAAEKEYERAAHLDPSEDNIMDWGAELLLHQALEPAIEVFTAGLQRHPRSAKLEIGLGIALYARNRYDDAVKALGLAADLDPSDPRPYGFLAKAYKVSSAEAEGVTERLRRFAELEPRSAEAQYYYALSLWKGRRNQSDPGHFGEIETRLKRAIALDPNFSDAHLQLGILYSEQHQYQQAIAQYEQAVRLNPDLSDAHYRLGQALVRVGEKAHAQGEFALYDRLHRKETAETERRRSEIKQFVYTMRQTNAAAGQADAGQH
jgi:tetratricopeptide (TPR) repeat protein